MHKKAPHFNRNYLIFIISQCLELVLKSIGNTKYNPETHKHKEKPAEAQATCHLGAVEERADATFTLMSKKPSSLNLQKQTTLPGMIHFFYRE